MYLKETFRRKKGKPKDWYIVKCECGATLWYPQEKKTVWCDCGCTADTQSLLDSFNRRLTVAKKTAKRVAKKAARARSNKGSRASKRTAVSKAKKGKPKGRSSVYDRIAKEQSERKAFSGGEFFQFPKNSRTQVRVFSYTDADGDEAVFAEDIKHWGIDPQNRGASIRCSGDECPVCELIETGDLDDKLAKRIRPTKRYLANAVVRKAEDGKDKQVILQMPTTVYNEMSEFMIDDDYGDILDHVKGRDFKVSKSGEGLKTRYKTLPMQATSKLGMTVEPVNLDKFIKPPSDEDVDSVVATLQE